MRTQTDGVSRPAAIIYRALLIAAAVLVCVLAAGTAFALFAKKPQQRAEAKTATSAETGLPPPTPASGTAYFTGIGKIRASSAGEKPAAVIVSIAFQYDRGDIAFSEELAAKTKEFREIAKTLFSSRTVTELRKTSEAELKEELLKRYNSALLLGRIAALYFNDYLLID